MKLFEFIIALLFCIASVTLNGQEQNEAADSTWLPEKKLEQDITPEEWEAMSLITAKFPAPRSAEGVSTKYYSRYSGGVNRPETWADVTPEHKAKFGQHHLSILCDMPRIYFTDPTEAGRDSAKKVFLQQARLTLYTEDSNSGSGKTYQMGKVKFGANMLAMKDVMKEAGIYDDFARVWSLHKRFMLEEYPRENMDWTRDRLGLCWSLTANMDDGPDKLHRLRMLQRSTTMSYQKLITPDGGAFHHNMDHLSYASYSFKSVIRTALNVRGTLFKLSDEVYNSIQAYVWAHGISCYKQLYPDNLAARNNLTPESLVGFEPWLKLLDDEYGDEDLTYANLYLTFFGHMTDKHHRQKTEAYLARGAEPIDLNIHHSYNVSAAAIHRQPNWVVSINGTRAPIKGSELYVKTGYPRSYMSNSAFGSIQISQGVEWAEYQALKQRLDIQYPDDSKFVKDSLQKWVDVSRGYVVEGWDFNHYAGVTAPVLPLKKLALLLKSGRAFNYSTFCGGTSLGENGIWGMIFSRYAGYEVCRKSAFCFGNRITVLTSDIKPTNLMYAPKFKEDTIVPTHTTLFQYALDYRYKPVFINGEEKGEFPFECSIDLDEPVKLMDHNGNGYYIHAGDGNKLHVSRKTQNSFNFANLSKDIPANIKALWDDNMREEEFQSVLEYCNPTPGDFSLAYIDHDTTMVGSSAFTIYVQGTPTEGELPYEILRQDSVAHILKDNLSSTTGYVVFKAGQELEQGVLKTVSRPSTVMVKNLDNETISCSVSSTEYTYDGAFLENFTGGVFNPDASNPIVLSFKGEWILEQNSRQDIVCTVNDGTTVVFIPYKDYMPVTFSLRSNIISAATGVEVEQLNGVKVYPNPTVGNFQISDLSVGAEITLYSQIGRKIISTVASSQVETFDLSGYNNGVYFVEIRNGAEIKTMKIMKIN